MADLVGKEWGALDPILQQFADQRMAVYEPPAFSLTLFGPHPALSRRERENRILSSG
jgi:hypothetical protein